LAKLPNMLPEMSEAGSGTVKGTDGSLADPALTRQLHFKIGGSGDWRKEWGRFIGRLGGLSNAWRRCTHDVQDAAAMIMAAMYQAFIREGIDPENSVLTQIIHGVHPPLSGLADYIVVIKAGRTGGVRNRRPTVITWHKDWATIAFLHDRGYAFVPTEQQKNHLFHQASDIAGGKEHFLSEGFGTQGIWLVPARPHAHFLTSERMGKVLGLVAEAVIRGKFDPKSISSQRPANVPWTPKFFTPIDDVGHL
jgi:hypothetical protein